MSRVAGGVAAGHERTAEVAAEILADGGNAFDAAVAAFCAACVAEPVLASLGGGGFLMARAVDAEPLLYDFFAHTPRHKRPAAELDFRSMRLDFGPACQEFHIGMGSIATPGAIAGLFRIHRDLCRTPLARLVEPACALARDGVEVNRLQGYIHQVVAPILAASAESARHFGAVGGARIAIAGDRMRMPDLADTFEALVREGPDLFHRGELGAALCRLCREQGGHLEPADLARYRVVRRRPLVRGFHGHRLFLNPPPASGGGLIGFGLGLLGAIDDPRDAAARELRLARALASTQAWRHAGGLARRPFEEALSAESLARWAAFSGDYPRSHRGTTQISIADAAGNLVSLTLSNGEGCGWVIPDSGVVPNNMLGEEDLNPDGFHRWQRDRRLSSMMAPTLVACRDHGWVVTGSGGSNRIRSAVLQVLVNLLERGMEVEDAVDAPRLHLEGGLLSVETPRPALVEARLREAFAEIEIWPGRNLFFGGAHTLRISADGVLQGRGDPRRGGVFIAARRIVPRRVGPPGSRARPS